MNIDTFIVASVILESGLFLCLQILVFRHVKQQLVLKWLTYLYFTAGLTGAFIEYLILSQSLNVSEQLILLPVILFINFTLYSLCVFIYIISIFGALESAIRIKLLDLVNCAGNIGIKETDILRKYNKNIIIRKRLQRMASSGELSVKNNVYRINRRWSLIFIPALLTKYICRIYGFDNNLFKKFSVR